MNIQTKTAFVVIETDDTIIAQDVFGQNKVQVVAVFVSKYDAVNYVSRYRLGRNLTIQEAVLNPEVKIAR